ncbi:MAG: hypothetical protein ACO2PO_01765 [Candidatus Calescibacterium sp.]
MPMCKIYPVTVALMIGFLLIASCKLSGDPEIINSTAVNEGKDLKIEWKKLKTQEAINYNAMEQKYQTGI